MSHAVTTETTSAENRLPFALDRRCERLSISAMYGAVPWACPENVSVDLDLTNIREVTTTAIAEIVAALASVPAAARPHTDTDFPVGAR